MKIQNTSLTFETSDQSLWRPGPAEPFRIDTGDFMIYDTGELTYNISLDAGVVEFTAQAYFGMRFGLVAWAELGSTGSWEASYDIDVNVGVTNALVVGRKEADGKTYVADPSQIELDFSNFEVVSAEISSEGFAFGDGDTTEIFGIEFGRTSQMSAGLDLVIGVQAGIRNMKVENFFKDINIGSLKVIDVDQTVNLITVTAEVPEYTKEWGPFEFSATLPAGADTEGDSKLSGFVDGTGFSDTEFLTMEADLDELLTELISKAGPKGKAVAEALERTVFLEKEFSIGPADIEVTVVDITAHLGVGLTEDVRLDIRDPSTVDPNNLRSGTPDINIMLRSDSGTPDDTLDDTYQEAKLGQSGVFIDAPHGSVGYGTTTIHAEYCINKARFGHDVGIGLNTYIGFEILKAKIDVWGLDKTIGPLFEKQFPSEEDSVTRLGDIYSDEFNIDGGVFSTDSDSYEVFYVEESYAPVGWQPDLPTAEEEVYGYFEDANAQLEVLFNALVEVYADLYPDDPFTEHRPRVDETTKTDYTSETDKVSFVWGGRFSQFIELNHGDGSRVAVATPTSTIDGTAPENPLYGELHLQVTGDDPVSHESSIFEKYDLLTVFGSAAPEVRYSYVDEVPDVDKYLITANVTNVVGGEGADVILYHYDRSSTDTRGGEYFDGGDNVLKDGTFGDPPVIVAGSHVGDLFLADLSHFTTPIFADLAESVRLENDGLSGTRGGITLNRYQMDPETGGVLLDADRLPVPVDDLDDRIILRNMEALALTTGSGDDYLVGGTFTDIFLTGAGDDVVRLVRSIPTADVTPGFEYEDMSDDLVDLGAGDDVILVEMSNDSYNSAGQYTDHVIGGRGTDHLFIEAGNRGLRYEVMTAEGPLGGGIGIGARATHAQLAALLSTLAETRDDRWYNEGIGNFSVPFGSGGDYGLIMNGPGNYGEVRFNRDVERVSIIPDAEGLQGAGDDLMVYMGGSRYDGGAGGVDTFLADFMGGYAYQSLGGTGAGVSISLMRDQSYFGATVIENVDRLHIRGTFDFDVITGGIHDDYIDGGDADDRIYGGVDTAADILLGGSGNDRFTWANDGDDTIFGGFDIDTLDLSSAEQPYDPSNPNGTSKERGGLTVAFYDAAHVQMGITYTASMLDNISKGDALDFLDMIASRTFTVAGFSDHKVEFSEVERVNVTGSHTYDDLLIYDGGSYYIGGNGAADRDLFVADFRGQMTGIDFEVRYTRSIGEANGYWLGNDVYIDGIDQALIYGTESFDAFAGGDYGDMFFGGAGGDVFYGRGGNDTLDGGIGNDVFVYDGQGYDSISGGTEIGFFDLFAPEIPEFDTLFLMGGSGPLRLRILDVFGDDMLTSSGGMALTTSTYDTLQALAEVNWQADTWLYYMANSNNLNAQSNTHVTYDQMELVNIVGTDLYDDLVVFQNGDSYSGGEGFFDADLFLADLRGATEDLIFDATYTAGEAYDIGQGTQIADFERFHLLLGSGDDLVLGGAEDDAVQGGAGNDSMIGGLGNDRFEGQEGDDSYEHTGGHDTVSGGAGGEDVLLIGGTDDAFTVAAFDSADSMLGAELTMETGGPGFADFAAFLNLATTAYVQVGHGDNSVTFDGFETVDMSGSDADDVLISGSGGGVLFGGAGADALIGLGGDDFMSGGAGPDIYVFGADFGTDVIFGENFGNSRLVFTALAMSDLVFSADGIDLMIGQGGNSVRVIDYFAADARFGLNFVFETTQGIATRDFTSLGVTAPGAPQVGETFIGTEGDDVFDDSSPFRDTYRGFAGNDAFTGSAGADLYDGAAGDDVVDYALSPEAIEIDLEALKGVGGDAEGDLLLSVEQVFGTSFGDSLSGDREGNTLSGEDGDDTLVGRGGDDILLGEAGDDLIDGGDGADSLTGGDGSDTLTGGAENDLLIGGDGNDELRGNDGDDLIDDGAGDDSAYGGFGDDVFGYNAGLDLWDGFDGRDIGTFKAFDQAVKIDLAQLDTVVTRDTTTFDPTMGVDRVLVRATGIEDMRGTFHDDLILGDAGDNMLDGSQGDDTLVGRAGDDTLIGGAGLDVLDYGRDGGTQGVNVQMQAEDAEYVIDSHGDRDSVEGVENVLGTVFADTMTGNDAGNMFHGGVGGDLLDGYLGDDLLLGQLGADTLIGGAGSDTLIGGDGDDSVLGGEGNDLIIGGGLPADEAAASSGRGSDVYYGGAGYDSLSYSTTTAGILVDLTRITGQITGAGIDTDTLAEIENIIGGLGNDTMRGNGEDNGFAYFGGLDDYDGGAGRDTASFLQFGYAVRVDLGTTDTVTTSDAATILPGTARLLARMTGIEDVQGTLYADVLIGDAQTNRLVGDAGNDLLDGGAGMTSDHLLGGAGQDTFIGADDDGADTLEGGDGLDMLDYSGNASPVDVSLETGNGDDSVTGVEGLIGTSGNDTLRGDSAANILRDGLGDDMIHAGFGDDIVVYEGGQDTVEGDDGIDTLDYSLFGFAVDVDLRLDGAVGFTGDAAEWYAGVERAITILAAPDVENVIGTGFDDRLAGNAGSNMLNGGAGNDWLLGYAGDDLFAYTGGFDEWEGGAGTDIANFASFGHAVLVDLNSISGVNAQHRAGSDLSGTTTTDMVRMSGIENAQGSRFDDQILGDGAANMLGGGAGDDVVDGRGGLDMLTGGSGHDTLRGGDGADTLEGGDGIDTATYAFADSAVEIDLALGAGFGGQAAGDLLSGIEGVIGTGHDDTLTGDGRDNQLDGAAGNDLLSGGNGTDILIGGRGNDTIHGGEGLDFVTIDAELAGITVAQGDGALQVTSADGVDLIHDDVEIVQLTDGIVGLAGLAHLIGAGNDTLIGTEASDIQDGRGGDDVLMGLGGHDLLFGGAGDDSLSGGDGLDRLEGGQGNDTLDGGAGRDQLRGGAGNDIYVVDDLADTVIEETGDGLDEIHSHIGLTLAANVENLRLLGDDDIDATGSGAANLLAGNAGDNMLTGLAGDDTLRGGTGTDTAIIAAASTSVTVARDSGGLRVTSTDGADLIHADVEFMQFTNAALSYAQLAVQLPEARLGTKARNLMSGTAAPDVMAGLGDNDTLTGIAGADILVGNLGNDSLSGGLDADTLDGGGGADTLDGGSGADLMYGGLGDDLFLVDNTGDRVLERPGEGSDTVMASTSHVLGDGVEALILTGSAPLDGTGNAAANALTGNTGVNLLSGGDGDDTLDGNGGNDTLDGGAGDDVARLAGDFADATVAFGAEGTVIVTTSAGTVTLRDIELLRFDDADQTAQSLRDTLIPPQNVQVSATDSDRGLDLSVAGGGAQVLYFGPASQGSNPGNQFHFSTEVEGGEGRAFFQGSGFNGDSGTANSLNVDFSGGNTQDVSISSFVLPLQSMIDADWGYYQAYVFGGDDTIYGSYHADSLVGYAGDDRILGGNGDKEFYNVITENPDQPPSRLRNPGDAVTNPDWFVHDGDDTIDGAGGNDSLDGGTGADMIMGGTGDDRLWGGGDAGEDTLDGGAGNDALFGGDGEDEAVFHVASTEITTEALADGVIITSADGVDTVSDDVELFRFADVTLTYGAVAGIGSGLQPATEGDDSLTGTDIDDTIQGLGGNDQIDGREGNDSLEGNTGADTMAGGLGDDTLAGGLGDDDLSGQLGDDALLGGAGNDSLYAGAGDDWIDGGAGQDAMTGGAGNDTFFADDAGDVITEYPGQGRDLVYATVSQTLTDYVEELILLGNADIDGTGNDANNLLSGNAGANVLRGIAGANTLTGGDGDDRLIGGTGEDTTVFRDVSTDIVAELSGPGLQITSSEGVDTVDAGIEFLRFGDGTFSRAEIEAMASVIDGPSDGDDTLSGTDGNDVIDALGGNDSVDGFKGADTLAGGEGNDILNGHKGFDVLSGGAGDDTLNGNDGDDLLTGQDGDDLLSGDVGADTLQGGPGADTMSGGTGADNLTGQRGFDVIYGGAGVDTILGNDGNDRIEGEDGDDSIEGGQGFDTLLGGFGADVITGGNGFDDIAGGKGFDRLFGNAGLDTLYGGLGNDLLDGGEDNDLLFAGDGDDTLQGRAGDDTLTGGAGADTLSGGIGADLLAGDDGNDLINGDDGSDSLRGGVGFDSLYGGVGSDDLQGGNGFDLLVGGKGFDTLLGEAGNDTLSGGLGDDVLDGGDDNDQLSGEDGNDRLTGGLGNDTIYGGLGADRVAAGGGDDVVLGGNGRDNAELGAGNDVYTDTDQDGDPGMDTVSGSGGDDTIDTGAGDDILNGGEGADSLIGGLGADQIFGGLGADTIDAGNGFDTVYGGDGQDMVTLGNGNDRFFDTAQGGNPGRDMVFGGAGDDTILGGGGDDSFFGGDGRDVITGGAGNDLMRGGNGIDTFIMVDGFGDDVIEDYVQGLDGLEFDAAYRQSGQTGAAFVSQFASVAGGNVVFAFGDGSSLTLEGLTTTAGLAGDIDFF